MDNVEVLTPQLPLWKHTELLQWGKNIFCISTCQNVGGILINDNSHKLFSSRCQALSSGILLVFGPSNNSTIWVLLLSPFADKETDTNEWEQGPHLLVPGWAPSSSWLMAGAQCTLLHYMNGERMVGLLLAQLQGAPFTLCSVYGGCEWDPLCHGSPDDRGQNWLPCPRT